MVQWAQKLPASARIVDSEKFLIEKCRGKNVLHIGCIDTPFFEHRIQTGMWLHSKLAQTANNIVGVDIDEEGVSTAINQGYSQIFCINFENTNEVELVFQSKFDIVVAGHVIEHVFNVGNFLSSAGQVLNNHGELILTTPNATRYTNFLAALAHYEMVHPDHVAWYSFTTLGAICQQHSFSIKEVHFSFKRRRSLQDIGRETSSIFQRLSKQTRIAARYLIEDSIIRYFPLFADNLVCVAKKTID